MLDKQTLIALLIECAARSIVMNMQKVHVVLDKWIWAGVTRGAELHVPLSAW